MLKKEKGFQKDKIYNRFLIWMGSRRLWHGRFIYRLDSLLINCWSFRVRSVLRLTSTNLTV